MLAETKSRFPILRLIRPPLSVGFRSVTILPVPENLRLLKTKLHEGLAQLIYLPQALALVSAAARRWTVAWAILLVLQGLLPIAVVFLTRTVVDSLVTALDAGGDWTHLRHTLLLVALMAGIMLLLEVLRSLTAWVRLAQSWEAQMQSGRQRAELEP